MKISLLPLYSHLNPGPGNCPLDCQSTCLVDQKAPDLKNNPYQSCPLSLHQAKTCAQVRQGEAEVIFNTAATGDGKSLAGYLPGLLDPKFRIMGLYPTIELVTDQERQVKKYCEQFDLKGRKRVDSLYGAELARRVEEAEKGNKFKQLRLSIMQKHVILTNPDIFHLVTHFRYQNPAYDQNLLVSDLVEYPHLYIADEFHIFGVHQEAAILNSLLLIRHSRQSKRPIRFLFTSATPKLEFIKQLKEAGFQVATVEGEYVNKETSGFRQISQPVELEFVELERDTDSLTWLTSKADTIRSILKAEQKHPGRGLIILNSIALVRRAVAQLKELLEPDVMVKEVSGIIDRQERTATQENLRKAAQPVLVLGTSAVDVGVDFDIHLLIFEASDSATFIQRLGRLGRHEGFSTYKAFVLLPGWMRWILPKLREKVKEGEPVDRTRFREEVVEYVFDPPKEFQQYRTYWGALQAQGMLFSMSRGNAEVMQQVRDRMTEDLRRVYGEQLDKKRGHWFALGKDDTGKEIQEELLRFRGGSDLQAAVWDGFRFYTYDLLKLLPHAEVEVIDRDKFIEAMKQFQPQRSITEFRDRYLQVYLKLQSWSDERFQIELECEQGTDELKIGTLSLIDGLRIEGHPQKTELNKCLHKRKLLTFLATVNHRQPNSHWKEVRDTLRLSPMFGLYRLIDADEQAYACAFNQDALLLEALKWKLKRCAKTKPYIY